MFTAELNTYSPSKAFVKIWKHLKPKSNQNKIFQRLIVSIFYCNKISPLYFDSSFFPYKNIEFDCATFSKENGPIIIHLIKNCESSLGEIINKNNLLRQIYPTLISFLVTMDAKEAANANKKIKTGQILGLDEVVVADTAAFDKLIDELKTYTLYDPEPVEVLTSTRFISGQPTDSDK